MAQDTSSDGLVWLVLDQLGQGVAGFDGEGRLRYSNAWLRARFQHGQDGGALEVGMTRFSRALLDQAGAEPARTRTAMRELGRMELATGGSRHLLRGLWINPARRNDEIALMVLVERQPEDPPSEGNLRERFGLSRQEIRIARLLAEGRTNSDIATALHISPHTARNHTRRVLAKLGVTSRSQVGPRVLGRGAEPGLLPSLRPRKSHPLHRSLQKIANSGHVAAA